MIESTASHLWETAICMKHPSFADEREWRLYTIETLAPMSAATAQQVGAKAMKMSFRNCSGRVVPYLEIEYDPLPLSEIVLGSSDPHLEDDPGIQFLLQRSNLGGLKVRRSSVPVRH